MNLINYYFRQGVFGKIVSLYSLQSIEEIVLARKKSY